MCVYIYIYIYVYTCICMYVCIYIYIYIFICVYVCVYVYKFRGNHLSNTTCLRLVFFKNGELCSNLWRSLTRRNTHTTNEAALDKSCQTSSTTEHMLLKWELRGSQGRGLNIGQHEGLNMNIIESKPWSNQLLLAWGVPMLRR